MMAMTGVITNKTNETKSLEFHGCYVWPRACNNGQAEAVTVCQLDQFGQAEN